MQKRVFSGIQPSGNLHLGNYLGAIKSWVASQDEYDNIFCIVDLHAITVPQDPQILKAKIRETAAILLASGIDAQKSALFIQSHISAHTELAWILNCFIPIGWMQRMTQFKEKSAKQKEKASVGLFDYPALMAADILLYETDLVPVGEDQKQHVELTRDIAQRFNSIYGETFKLPRAVIHQVGARIMSLTHPEEKMSKSDKDKDSAIYLLDSPSEIKRKIMSAVTDSKKVIVFDQKRPGLHNLLVIYELLCGEERTKIEESFRGRGYADFKKKLADLIVEELRPIQMKYAKLIEDKPYLDSLLADNAEKIRPFAERTLTRVKEKTGLG